jgi:hypothetical protein
MLREHPPRTFDTRLRVLARCRNIGERSSSRGTRRQAGLNAGYREVEDVLTVGNFVGGPQLLITP